MTCGSVAGLAAGGLRCGVPDRAALIRANPPKTVETSMRQTAVGLGLIALAALLAGALATGSRKQAQESKENR